MSDKPTKGRPTKYTEDMPQILLDYFNVDLFDTVSEEVASQGKAVAVVKRVPKRLPTFERFCVDNNLHHSTLLDWKRKYPDFSEAYDKAKYCQKDFLMQHGLLGTHNAGYSKFVSINVTDMKDKVEHEHNASEFKVVLPDERAAKL